MKITDFGARIAPFDYYLSRRRGTCYHAIELGVDAGAHAQSMLQVGSNIEHFDLVDVWTQMFTQGICKGRLDALGFHGIYQQHRTSAEAFLEERRGLAPLYDAIYCDLPQDGPTAERVFEPAWLLLRPAGLMGYRNYGAHWDDMKRVIDRRVERFGATTCRVMSTEANEIVIEKL